jgi:hypothetical protein
LILIILDHVVGPRPEIQETVADNLQHVRRRLLVGGPRVESPSQQFDRLAPETRQSRVQHERHQRNDRFLVGSETTLF